MTRTAGVCAPRGARSECWGSHKQKAGLWVEGINWGQLQTENLPRGRMVIYHSHQS